MKPVNFELGWTHLSNLPLADPGFGRQGRVNILLGADVFVEILGQGWRKGPAGSPTAFETDFGWVLCGGLDLLQFMHKPTFTSQPSTARLPQLMTS